MTESRGFKFAYLKSLHGKELTGGQYRILVTLLDYAKGNGTGARPGIKQLATDCQLSERTVRRELAWLRDHEYIIEMLRGRKGFTTEYRFPTQEDTHGPLKDILNRPNDSKKPVVQPVTHDLPTEYEQRGTAENDSAEVRQSAQGALVARLKCHHCMKPAVVNELVDLPDGPLLHGPCAMPWAEANGQVPGVVAAHVWDQLKIKV